MNIDLTQFRLHSLPASEFADRAYSALESVQNSPGFHRRIGTIKNLVEEIVPLATFIKYLEGPQRRVRCRYLGSDADQADAMMSIRGKTVAYGMWPRRRMIEITTACHQRAYLQRELLERKGSAFLGPGIRRSKSRHQKGSEIIDAPAVQAAGHDAEDCAHLIRTVVAKKADRIGRRKRLLIVNLEPEGFLSPRHFREAADLAYDHHTARMFAGIFLVHTSSGQVTEIA